MKDEKVKISFAAIDPYIKEHKVLPTQKEIRGQEYFAWGDDNKYPQYLYELYSNVPTLQSIINTLVDYVCGDEIISDWIYDTNYVISDLIFDIVKSYAIYGGYALSIVRNKLGDVAQISCLDFRNLRSNKEGTHYYYSTDFGEKSYGRIKTLCYPKFDKEQTSVLSSIFYYKDDKYSVYPTPLYGAAITACEIEKSIDDYHLNSINNNFMGSVLLSFNNGVPDDNIKNEIEKNFNEKFTGKENAGRVVISYSDDKEHALTLEKIDTEDFSERYKSLAERSQQAMFTAFRMTPTLVGINDNTKGFAREQYADEYALFNKTMVKPIQKMILRSLSNIIDANIEIKPFTIEFEDNTQTDKNIEV